MRTLKKSVAAAAVGVFALGLSLLGATAAHADGTWRIVDVCGSANDTIIVTGDYRFILAKPYGWGVYDGDPNTPGTLEIANANGVGGGAPFHPGDQLGDYGCPPQAPPEPEPPAPPAPPAPEAKPGQTTGKAPAKPPTGTTTEASPDAAGEPTPTETIVTVVDPESPVSGEPVHAVTTSSADEPAGNLIIPIGGAVLLATAIGGLGYTAARLGWFKPSVGR